MPGYEIYSFMKKKNDYSDRSPRMRKFLEQRPGLLMRWGIPLLALVTGLLALIAWQLFLR